MTTETATNHTDPGRRHDFVLLFDVRDGNPNGDPDAGNAPRLDPDTMHGLVTDVAIKRKVRDYVDAARGAEQRYKIYVQRESYLTDTRARVFGDHSDGSDPEPATAREWMCDEFYDVRMFGAVMSMREKNSGQVRGPAQFTFARSIDPILHLEHTIGRVALETRGERAEQRDGDERQAPTHGTLGRKSTVPYALYLAHGFFNPHFAAQTGADADDLALFWTALQMMWDLDRSAARGLMACRGLFVFSHQSPLGNAPASTLFDRIRVARREHVDSPRSSADYSVEVDEEGMPEGVTLTRLVG
ncbi:MAG: type I-C CRISPR-associated protein Cas7/Csd2 [Chloroflexi bacterium]|nr:type I-C CRISPR-associated protein Cas7/Csd2 [Chloroflexota bacterium]